jgi:hypothetical protein
MRAMTTPQPTHTRPRRSSQSAGLRAARTGRGCDAGTGVTSPFGLGTLALAALAQPEPVAAFMHKNRGRLGEDHELDY